MTALTIRAPRRARPSPRLSPRRRTAEIIDAAARVFAERGFHGATTQDIADVLGIRQASLYYYFTSKEDALEQVCTGGVEGFFEAAAVIAAGPESAAEKVRKLIEAHLSPLLNRRDFVRVFLNERQHLPADSRRRIGRWSRAYERVIEEVVKAGIRNGEFRPDLDARVMTLGLLGMANAVSAWYGKEPGAGIDRLVQQYSWLVLDGMVKRPTGRRPTR